MSTREKYASEIPTRPDVIYICELNIDSNVKPTFACQCWCKRLALT